MVDRKVGFVLQAICAVFGVIVSALVNVQVVDLGEWK